MIKIYTDSTSYIPSELIQEYGITVLSLSVSLDGQSYLETEIENEEFFYLMDQSNAFPQSSQPSPSEAEKRMKADAAAGHSVVGVFISSLMSGTYEMMNMVRQHVLEEVPDASITLIDSGSNCMQLGLAVLAGAEAAAQGKSVAEVEAIIRDTMKRTRFIFIPKNLHYLEKGGRIGHAKALIGSLLNIIPILTVKNGLTDQMMKVRTYKKAIGSVITILQDDTGRCGIEKIYVAHINALEEAKRIVEKIKSIINIRIDITHIGPVIGAHVGPGAVGLIYQTVEPING